MGKAAPEGVLPSIDTLDARQFQITIKKLADSLSYGTDRSPFLGAGIEYVQSRAYQAGDPIRIIDWRVTARTGRVHVKEYESPKRMPCYLLLDTSASMTISSQPRSKYATAVHIAGGIAFACLDRVSPVGILGAGERALRVEPSLSRQQILQWLHRLRRYRFDESTMLARRITELRPSLTSRALVIVLSDLHDTAALPVLQQLAQAHDVVALWLRDPAEYGLRGAGLLRAREAETGRTFVTLGRTMWADDTATEAELKHGGVDWLRIQTDQPFAHRLRHFFRSRGVLGKGTR